MDMPPADTQPDEPEPARLTPYELVFGSAGFEEEHFPAIVAEAHEHEVDTSDPDRFLFLTAVGNVLRAMLPDDAMEPAVQRYGMLLFQAFNFWRFDRHLYFLEQPVARYLVETPPPVGEWELIPPHPAGYVQLPRHLFWASVQEDATPEPVDGFFWTMVGEEDPAQPPYGRLDTVLALGLRPGRAGLSAIAVGAKLGGGPGHWADADARPGGQDFANILPGGELEGLYAITTEAEALKLISLVFWYVADRPTAVGEPEAESEARKGRETTRKGTQKQPTSREGAGRRATRRDEEQQTRREDIEGEIAREAPGPTASSAELRPAREGTERQAPREGAERHVPREAIEREATREDEEQQTPRGGVERETSPEGTGAQRASKGARGARRAEVGGGHTSGGKAERPAHTLPPTAVPVRRIHRI